MPTTGSPINAGTQGSKAARIAAWSLAAAIVVLSLAPPALRPETSAPHSPPVDPELATLIARIEAKAVGRP